MKLWPTVSRQFYLGVGPSFGVHDQIFRFLLLILNVIESKVGRPLCREDAKSFVQVAQESKASCAFYLVIGGIVDGSGAMLQAERSRV
jgi:hypothetical protein